ncbi:MAG: mRNA surveillance protein pelota [archaeon]|nr:mRNA surveillance protein pelota [archaeon]
MKITYQNRKEGVIEVFPETLDDLWHLSHIVAEGDKVSTKTTRRIQDTSGDKIRGDRGVKKTFTIGVVVESISFHMFTGKLRFTGSIYKGPEDLIPMGSYHTLEAKLNTPLRIEKEKWSKYAINRVERAIESSKKLSSIIVALEDDVAYLGLIRQFGPEYYGPIVGNISGKRVISKNRKKNIEKFHQTIVDSILKYNDVQTIVIAGPGFYKSDFLKFLEDKHKDLAKKSILEDTGSGGRPGIKEVLRKGTLEKLTTENRVAFEISAVNDILEEIAKTSELVVYGKKDVKNAINLGAIQKLLVLDTIVRSEDLEDSMDMVENMSGEVLVISSEHEGGKQLAALGGLAATLRYPIN